MSSQALTSVEEYDWPMFVGLRPFEHQKVTTNFLLANKRAYVLNEMGTGKTLSVLWAVDILLRAGRVRRVLVVCPLSTMRAVWMKEVQRNVPHLKLAVAHGTAQERVEVWRSSAQIVVINHDGIKVIEDEIASRPPDILVIDELTAFKSHDAQRSKCMNRIASHCRAVWGMTGEMTPNSPLEAFYQCKIVNPDNKWLPRYFGQFRDACMTQINEYLWLPKPVAPQIVATVAQPSIRFTRDQCLDLPDTSYHVLNVPLSKDQQAHYEAMRKQMYIECESGNISASNAAVKLNKLLQISAGAVKNDGGDVVSIGAPDRVAALVDLFEQTPNHKLVVPAVFRATIAMLEVELTKRSIRVASIHGDVPQQVRADLIERFQSGDLQVLILQPQSSAHGITLTAASTIVWFSMMPSNELYQQTNARIIRAGQTRKTQIVHLISTAADEHIYNILQRKGDVSKETMQLLTSKMI